MGAVELLVSFIFNCQWDIVDVLINWMLKIFLKESYQPEPNWKANEFSSFQFFGFQKKKKEKKLQIFFNDNDSVGCVWICHWRAAMGVFLHFIVCYFAGDLDCSFVSTLKSLSLLPTGLSKINSRVAPVTIKCPTLFIMHFLSTVKRFLNRKNKKKRQKNSKMIYAKPLCSCWRALHWLAMQQSRGKNPIIIIIIIIFINFLDTHSRSLYKYLLIFRQLITSSIALVYQLGVD